MKTLLVLSMFLFTFTSFCEGICFSDTFFNKSIFVKEYYDTGELKQKGKKVFQEKYTLQPSGNLYCMVKTSLKQGRWVEYHKNGQKKRVVRYSHGDLVKVLKSWSKNGLRVN